MKGIDYLIEINRHLPCIFTFWHPHAKKLVFCPERDSNARLPDYQSGMLFGWGCRKVKMHGKWLPRWCSGLACPTGNLGDVGSNHAQGKIPIYFFGWGCRKVKMHGKCLFISVKFMSGRRTMAFLCFIYIYIFLLLLWQQLVIFT